ncbi:hypothetical protein B0H13DRAFT_1855940 [Mycena leptocephala]|nr:hypothetical protein B0H13DRAFT_1855940 [Mycena leptocephala]
MCQWINEVLVPYLNAQRERLHLRPSQRALLIIDVWSVHRSADFQDRLRETHPNILIDFIGSTVHLSTPSRWRTTHGSLTPSSNSAEKARSWIVIPGFRCCEMRVLAGSGKGTRSTRDYCPGDDEEVIEDLEEHEDEDMGEDDSEIPTHEVKAAKGNSAVGLGSSGEAEDADADISEAEETVVDEPTGK